MIRWLLVFHIDTNIMLFIVEISIFHVQYVVLGPRKSPMPLVRVFSENDKIFRQEKKIR